MNKRMDPGMIVDPLDNPGKMILQDVNKPISGSRALGLMDLLLVQYLNWLEGQLIGNTFFACRYTQDITNCPMVLQRFVNLMVYSVQYSLDVILESQVYFVITFYSGRRFQFRYEWIYAGSC